MASLRTRIPTPEGSPTLTNNNYPVGNIAIAAAGPFFVDFIPPKAGFFGQAKKESPKTELDHKKKLSKNLRQLNCQHCKEIVTQPAILTTKKEKLTVYTAIGAII